MKILDLSRTEKAIKAYDKFDAAFDPSEMSGLEVVEGFSKLDLLAEAVGEAFGFDTADRNSIETCKQVVRPGPKVPGPGYELSFVRRMVAKWKEEKERG